MPDSQRVRSSSFPLRPDLPACLLLILVAYMLLDISVQVFTGYNMDARFLRGFMASIANGVK
jgi:hypothetical protein